MWNGPSYAPSHQVRISVIFAIRAHTTDSTTGRRMCDGPSSGYRRAINEINPTRPGWTPFQILTVYTPHPSKFHPITSTSSHLPSLFHFHTSPTDHYFHNLPNLITISYLSVLLFLVSTLPPESFPTCVFSISKVCVSKFILISPVFLFISYYFVSSRLLLPWYDYV